MCQLCRVLGRPPDIEFCLPRLESGFVVPIQNGQNGLETLVVVENGLIMVQGLTGMPEHVSDNGFAL